MSEIGNMAAKLRDQAAFLELLERAMSDDDEFISKVRVLIGKNGSAGVRVRKKRKGGRTFRKIAALFSADDVWLTIPEIIEKSGLTRSAISNVVYKANKDDFDQKDHPTRARVQLWRLKPGAKQ